MQVRLERRLKKESLLQRLAVAAASVVAALILGALFLVLSGFSPLTVYYEMFRAAFTTWYGITDTLAVAIPLILTGLAAAVAFRMGLYNIGAEGQLYVGAILSSWAALAIAPGLPRPLAMLVVLGAGLLGGALWILVPAVARVWLGTSEIITTLLLNFVALYLMRYLIYGSASYWRDPRSVGAILSSWAALAIAPGLPRPLAMLVVLGAGLLGGALWILVPAVARVWLGTSEIITTLLLNFVALYLMRYLIYGSASYWRDP